MKWSLIPPPRAGIAQPSAAESKLDQAQNHADARCGEAPVPAVLLCQPATDHRADGRAEIHAHVKNGEAGIPPGAPLRIQVRDKAAHVRLEGAAADDDKD